MKQFQLKVVPIDSVAPDERRLSLGSIWRFQTLSPCANRRNHLCSRRSPARSVRPLLTRVSRRPALWWKSARPHLIIFRQPTRRLSLFPSRKKPGANPHLAGAIRFARASARMSLFGSFIINAARHLTPFRHLRGLKPGSRLNPFSCSITHRLSILWSRVCPRRSRKNGWLSISSPNRVKSL